MNDVLEIVVPAAATSVIFLIIFGFVGFMRYMRYKETVALAERGLLHPRYQRRGRGRRRRPTDTLRWGVILTFLSVGLCIGLYPIGELSELDTTLGLGPWLLLATIPMFFGLALITIHALSPKGDDDMGDEFMAPEGGETVEPVPEHKRSG